MSVGRHVVCALIAGSTMFQVGLAFHAVGCLIDPLGIAEQYKNVALYRPWPGWTSVYMIIHPFGFAVVFTAVYLAIRTPGGLADGWRGGLKYGAGLFLVGSLPVYLLAFAAFQASAAVIASWIAQSACQYIAAGAAVGWIVGMARDQTSAGEGHHNEMPPLR